MELLNANGVPSGAILSLEDALKQPQIKHRETLKDVPVEGIGTVPLFYADREVRANARGHHRRATAAFGTHRGSIGGYRYHEDELADLKDEAGCLTSH